MKNIFYQQSFGIWKNVSNQNCFSNLYYSKELLNKSSNILNYMFLDQPSYVYTLGLVCDVTMLCYWLKLTFFSTNQNAETNYLSNFEKRL